MSRNQYDFGMDSHTGMVREKNEDSCASFSTPFGQCFLVCDGMGGHSGGQTASRLAVDTIQSFLTNAPPDSDPSTKLAEAIHLANERVREKASEEPSLAGMGSTCVALIVETHPARKAWVAHVGDSRAYLLRNGKLERATIDHSKVMEMVSHGIITIEEARVHPRKNEITRAIGVHDSIKPEVRDFPIFKGDRFLLCSDGITDLISDDELQRIVSRTPVEEAPGKLVELANDRGGHDNSTIYVVELKQGTKPKAASGTFKNTVPQKHLKDIGVFLAGAAVVALAFFIFRGDRVESGEVQDVPSGEEQDSLQTIDAMLPADSIPYEEEVAPVKEELIAETEPEEDVFALSFRIIPDGFLQRDDSQFPISSFEILDDRIDRDLWQSFLCDNFPWPDSITHETIRPLLDLLEQQHPDYNYRLPTNDEIQYCLVKDSLEEDTLPLRIIRSPVPNQEDVQEEVE